MLAILLTLWFLGVQQEAATAPVGEPPREMVRAYDADRASRCVGAMVGFRNVWLMCRVGDDDHLRDCTLQSDDPRVRRHQRVFFCMAGAMKVRYADGGSAAGQQVRFTVGLDRQVIDREAEAERPPNQDAPRQ